MHTITNPLGQPIGPHVSDWTPRALPVRTPMQGRFCRLEPLELALHGADLHAAYAADTEARMWTYLSYGPFATPADLEAWHARVAATRDPLFFAIRDATTGRAVGAAAYLRIDPNAGSIEVGHLAFSPALARTPAATEAMFLMMKHAFTLGYRRYEWKCDALNARSRAAALRLGLSFEGVFRQAGVYRDRNRDTAWFAAVDSEWPALRAAHERWLAPGNFDTEGRQRERLSDLTAPLLVKR